MIEERTPDEKFAYADGFKQCIKWFETHCVDYHTIKEAEDHLHALMFTISPENRESENLMESRPRIHWPAGYIGPGSIAMVDKASYDELRRIIGNLVPLARTSKPVLECEVQDALENEPEY